MHYYHSAITPVIVKPDSSQVLPLAPEFIEPQDGHETTAVVDTLGHIGRARWKVENENNNVLKNRGYHFEHNFGHG